MDELTKLLSDMVTIDSTNPDLVPGAAGESQVAQFIAGWMERAGLEVRMVESAAALRPNVVGVARGTGAGRALLLNGHMDTVSKGDFVEAHKPRVENGRLYGRGAYDMKGGLAACMMAAAQAKKQQLRGDVIVTAVADEEYASIGTAAVAKAFHDGTLIEHGRGASEGQQVAAIVAEFTELQMIVAHKGFIWFEIETTGRAAHGSRPDLGVDAIEQMGSVLVELKHLNRARRAHPSHPLLGSGSLHASLIHGGQELSSYPEHCTLSVEIRTLPGETPEQVEGSLRAILQHQQELDATFKCALRRGIDRSPLETPQESGIAQAVQRAATTVLGHPAAVTGVPFWTDAALLSEAGIPSLLFGPAGAGAHAAEEWVDLASVQACAQVYLEAARLWAA